MQYQEYRTDARDFNNYLEACAKFGVFLSIYLGGVRKLQRAQNICETPAQNPCALISGSNREFEPIQKAASALAKLSRDLTRHLGAKCKPIQSCFKDIDSSMHCAMLPGGQIARLGQVGR